MPSSRARGTTNGDKRAIVLNSYNLLTSFKQQPGPREESDEISRAKQLCQPIPASLYVDAVDYASLPAAIDALLRTVTLAYVLAFYGCAFILPSIIITSLLSALNTQTTDSAAAYMSSTVCRAAAEICMFFWGQHCARVPAMRSEPKILLFTHLSTLDAVVINLNNYLFGGQVIPCVKLQIIFVPVLGWWAYLSKAVFVDRDDPFDSNVTHLNHHATRVLDEDRVPPGVFAIAPEGTRSVTGHCGALKRGAFKLIELHPNATVYTLAVCGGYELYSPSSANSNWLLRAADYVCPKPGELKVFWRTVDRDISSEELRSVMLEMTDADVGAPQPFALLFPRMATALFFISAYTQVCTTPFQDILMAHVFGALFLALVSWCIYFRVKLWDMYHEHTF
jgi:1-acyl-sn-glycerol-3-phosphate acyltransferase